MPPRVRLQSGRTTLPVTSPKETKLLQKSPTKRHKTSVKRALLEPRPAPQRWKEAYQLIAKQRKTFLAPVDTMGCDKAGDFHSNDHQDGPASTSQDEMEGKTITKKLNQISEQDRRLACLVSLMLSSQTKDQITSQATLNLRLQLPGSLTVDSLRKSSLSQIENCINKVGFWKKKAQFIKQMADDLYLKHNSDVPKTLEELIELKGVGPKMAFLALSSAWSINLGIGVDTHVHRISNRLGWVKTSEPEATRVYLESWLPSHLFQEINHLLVGFGQVICLPVGPKCDECFVGQVEGLCPSSNIKSRLLGKRKNDKKTNTRTSSNSKNIKIETSTDDINLKQEEDDEKVKVIKDINKTSKFFQSQLDETTDSLKKDNHQVKGKKKVLNTNKSTHNKTKIKIEIEDLNNNNINLQRENDVNNNNNNNNILSSPLSEISDDDHEEDCSINLIVNQEPHICSNQSFSW